MRDKVTRQCPWQNTFPKRRESRSGIEPRPFCIPTVPLGQTGSHIKCGSNRSRPYAPPSRPMGKLFGCYYCENSLPKKNEKTTTTTKETPHYNIAKLNQPRFMAQVKAVVNWRHSNGRSERFLLLKTVNRNLLTEGETFSTSSWLWSRSLRLSTHHLCCNAVRRRNYEEKMAVWGMYAQLLATADDLFT